MSAETTALFIAWLLAGMAASALALRELFRRLPGIVERIEELEDRVVCSGPGEVGPGEVEALREQISDLLKLRREVCEAIEINPNVMSHADVALAVREFVKVAKAVEQSKEVSSISSYEIEALRAEVQGAEVFRKAVCEALGLGSRCSYEGMLGHIRHQHDVFKESVDRQVGFEPVPPPREKKPRKPRKPKTEQAPEAGQVSLETALAEAAEQQSADDANDFVAQGDAQ